MIQLGRKRLFALIVVVFIHLAFYGLYLPYTANTDHDALAMIGYIRATGECLGWSNGMYVNGCLTISISQILNAGGGVYNDFLLAYKITIVLALLLIVILMYLLLTDWMQNVYLAATLVVAMGLSPGLSALLSQFEDNLISSSIHVLYFFVYYQMVKGYRSDSSGRWHTAIRLLFPISFALAIMAHHQLVVLIITPLFLYKFLDRLGRFQRLRLIGGIYAIASGIFLLSYAILTLRWDLQFDTSMWIFYIQDWFIPNPFFQKFYFFNRFGWDVPRQLSEIGLGVSQIFSADPTHTVYLAIVYLIGFSIVCQSMNKRLLATDSWRMGIGSLFLIIHIPHSLVYESAFLERWDVIIPVLVFLVSFPIYYFSKTACVAIGKYHIRPSIGLAIFLGGLISYNLFAYSDMLEKVAARQNTPIVKNLVPKLAINVNPDYAETKHVLVLSQVEFWDYFMLAEAYYSYRDSIYGVYPDGWILKSTERYIIYIGVSLDTFIELIQNKTLVLSPGERHPRPTSRPCGQSYSPHWNEVMVCFRDRAVRCGYALNSP